MLQQTTQPRMMQLLRSRSLSVCLCQPRIRQQRVQEQLEIRIGKALHKSQQLLPKLIYIARRARQQIALLHLIRQDLPQIIHLHLQPVIESRYAPAQLHHIAALKLLGNPRIARIPDAPLHLPRLIA